jgi:uncharacterized protein (DUF362 family)
VRRSRRVLFWALFAFLLLTRFGHAVSLETVTENNVPATVAIVRSDSTAPNESEVELMVRQALQLAPGLEDLIEPGDVVVIKPNLVLDVSPDSGMVTDTRVVRALVRIARELGAGQVYIAEGSARYSLGDPNRDRHVTRHAFEVAGYDLDGDMVDDVTGAPLVDLNISGETLDARDPNHVTSVNVATGLIRKEYWLPNLVLGADVLISVPVLKNHYLAGTTLGMKNMIGVAPNDIYHAPGQVCEKKELSHADVELQQHIVDLSLARKPDYVVIDGLRGMTDGPVGSQIVDPPMRLMIAGRDVVAVDTVGTLVMGYDPESVPYLQMAQQVNLGTTDTAWIQVVGEPVAQARRDFPAPYGELPVTRAESSPPFVDIASPQDGSSPKGQILVLVEARDDGGVARVELYLNDLPMGTDREPPYEFMVDTEGLSPGANAFIAVAYDKALNEARDQITIHLLSSEPTSTATSTAVGEISATLAPTARPTEVAMMPTLTTVEPSPTMRLASVTVSAEQAAATEGPVSRDTVTPAAGPSSITPPREAPLCGLPLVFVVLAIGIGVPATIVSTRRSP